jgi:hypothetical protein
MAMTVSVHSDLGQASDGATPRACWCMTNDAFQMRTCLACIAGSSHCILHANCTHTSSTLLSGQLGGTSTSHNLQRSHTASPKTCESLQSIPDSCQYGTMASMPHMHCLLTSMWVLRPNYCHAARQLLTTHILSHCSHSASHRYDCSDES